MTALAPQLVTRPTPARWRGGAPALAALAAISLAIPCYAGFGAAAQTEAAPTTAEEITVVAPEVVRRPAERGRHGQRIEVLSLTRKVSYADLDLTTSSGADELRNRINRVSREACRQLDAQAPSRPGTPSASAQRCEQNARVEALAVADQLVAAAKAP